MSEPDTPRVMVRDPGDAHRLKPPDWFLSLDVPDRDRLEQLDTDPENGTDD
jgi:hypothetical protein